LSHGDTVPMHWQKKKKMPITIAEVQSASAQNQQELFESLLRATSAQAFQLAFRLTGNRVDAEDLVQEAYIRAYRFFHRYDSSLPFSAWLYRILTNAHIDEVRRRNRFKLASLDEPHPETGTPVDYADSSPNPEALLVNDQMESEIQEGIQAMTPEFRIAVLLADMEGLSYEEIAEVMETSIGTVRSRIHRGRKQLRNYLLTTKPEKYRELLG
jgi:RNA polymerase sigma-70 factor (ECF subfamily)